MKQSFFDVCIEIIAHIGYAYDKMLPFIFLIGSIDIYLSHLVETF